MRAMILAAGEGTRLRPLTLNRSKAMVPVANKPNIGHVLDKVARAGITQAAVNLCYQADQLIGYLSGGIPWGVRLRFSRERRLRGTAGSLAPLANFFSGQPVVVLSGDGVSDLDLRVLELDHRRSGAPVTIVLTKINARFDYGLVRLNRRRRVRDIIEKPSWSDAFAPYVNTGIYVLEDKALAWIPKNRPYDFAREFFPDLLSRKIPVNAYVLDGYWCDIGNMREYLRCHRDILDGRTSVGVAGHERQPGIWIEKGARIHSSVILQGPLAIGRGARVEKFAKIFPYSVIGEGCIVGENAHIEESVLWADVTVAKGVRIMRCVLADRVYLRENVAFHEGAVLSLTNSEGETGEVK